MTDTSGPSTDNQPERVEDAPLQKEQEEHHNDNDNVDGKRRHRGTAKDRTTALNIGTSKSSTICTGCTRYRSLATKRCQGAPPASDR